MKITHIYHSGFLVETAACYYLFDYYKGTLPSLDPAKPIFVFASHGHADHYNPHVFPLLEESGMTTVIAVLSNDIPKKRYPAGYLPLESVQPLETTAVSAAPLSPVPASAPASSCCQQFLPASGRYLTKVYHSQEYDLPCKTRIQTLLSTDKGVAFLITCPEGILYHAGDLNDWNLPETPAQERKQMQGSFRASLSRLKGKSIDVAFLPLDPRLEGNYAEGFLYFLRNISAKKVFPMHFGDQPEVILRFLAEYPEYGKVINYANLKPPQKSPAPPHT